MKPICSLIPKSLLTGFFGLSLVAMFCSCAHLKDLTYMQGAFDTTALSKAKLIDPVIQKGDMISIIVYSDNPEATRIFNQALITTGAAGSGGDASTGITGATPSSPGYMVDENGNIEFQGLGLIHVDSMTRSVLKDTLNARLKPYLNNPYYNIRFLNSRFTMLGEVNRPGIFSIPGDHVNLLEALGMAGDMTFFGRRDNVLIIREINGKRQFARLDLTKPEIMISPYFYLQQNDVVIIEATNKKIAANDQTLTRNVTLAATLISVFAIIYTIFR
jgi:polysaccharide export outer membrane protein